MTGTLLLDPPEPPRYARVRFALRRRPRRCCSATRAASAPASWRSAATRATRSSPARLGVEPLGPDFTGAHLLALTRASRAPIKAFLLDQRKIAGVGNIYADEALFRARIHPLRPANRLTRAQVAALRDAVVASLEAGLAAKGASIDDFRHPDGVQGSFQDDFLVHLREGEPCLVCGRPVRKFVAAGRGTYVVRALPAPPAAQPSSGGGAELGQPARAVGRRELLKAADRLAVEDDLRERHHAGGGDELGPALGVLGEVDLVERDAAPFEQRLCRPAVAARFSGVDRDSIHAHFTKDSARRAEEYPLPGSLKTDGIVLRSMRYGEADRILHLFTPDRGRLSAIAKGVRRAKSRFGGRLEPFFRLRLVLYQGRSDLLTVTSAETLAGHPRLREDGAALDSAARACDAVSRLFDDHDPHRGVYHLLANQLALLDADATRATRANALAFRLKLLLAAGFAPQLAACAACGEGDHLSGFSGAAGGVVCAACEATAFPLYQDAHDFLVGALGSPLAEVRDAPPRALAQAERAIIETLEHHANVRLRPVGA